MRAAERTKVVVWDWNGTLLDDVEFARQAMNTMLGERGLRPMADLDAYRAVFRFPIPDFYARIGVDPTDFSAASTRYMELFNAAVVDARLFPAAVTTLDALRRRGIGQVLISATGQATLRHQLGPHAIDDRFDAILGIEDASRASKAHLVGEWLQRSPFEPAEVLMIGDTNHDVEIASALGLRFVQVSSGHQAPPTPAPHPVIGDLVHLPPLL